MKANEIRDLNDADLTARIAELEEERFRLRFRGATEQLEDPLRLRGLRRDVARLKTIQRERAIEQADAAKAATGAQPARAAKAGGRTATKPAVRKPATRQSVRSAGRAATRKSATRQSAAKKGAQGASTTKASAAQKKAPAKKAATGAGR